VERLIGRVADTEISRNFTSKVRTGLIGLALLAFTPAVASADSQTTSNHNDQNSETTSDGRLFGCSYFTLTIPGTDIKTGLLDVITVDIRGRTKERITTHLPKIHCDYLGNEPLSIHK